MDAFLGLYDNGSSDSDEEWIAQLDLGDPLGSNGNPKKNLPPEPQSGNIEYKLKLVNPTEQRIQHLVTQVIATSESKLIHVRTGVSYVELIVEAAMHLCFKVFDFDYVK